MQHENRSARIHSYRYNQGEASQKADAAVGKEDWPARRMTRSRRPNSGIIQWQESVGHRTWREKRRGEWREAQTETMTAGSRTLLSLERIRAQLNAFSGHDKQKHPRATAHLGNSGSQCARDQALQERIAIHIFENSMRRAWKGGPDLLHRRERERVQTSSASTLTSLPGMIQLIQTTILKKCETPK